MAKSAKNNLRPEFSGTVSQTITSMVTRRCKVHSARMLYAVKRGGSLDGLLFPSLSLILGIRSGPEAGQQVRIQMFPPKRQGASLETHKTRVNGFLEAVGCGRFLSKETFGELLDLMDTATGIQDLLKGKEFQATIVPWFAPVREDGALVYRDQHPDLELSSDERWDSWKEKDDITGNVVETEILTHWATDGQGVKLYTLISSAAV